MKQKKAWWVMTMLGVMAGAQASPIEPAADWREANDAVGRFERGHIDILRWEQQHARPPSETASAPGAVWSLNDALLAAQRARPGWLLEPGMGAMERIDKRLKQRALALEVEHAWINALASRHKTATWRQSLQAAESGHELAWRMARLGNWPEARAQQQALVLSETRAQWRAAEHAERLALLDLWRLSGEGQPVDDLARKLPPSWTPPAPPPDLADLEALQSIALQQHPEWPLKAEAARRATQSIRDVAQVRQALETATAPGEAGQPQPLPAIPLRARWPHAWHAYLDAQADAGALERGIRADVHAAHSAWRTATLMAEEARVAEDVLNALEQDMVQRYNGMFKSTWDLLAAARARLQATDARHQAELNVALALANLRAVLDGLPYTGSLPGAGTATAPSNEPGH